MTSPFRIAFVLASLVAFTSPLGAAPADEAVDAYDGDTPRLRARLWVDPAVGDRRWQVGVELAPDAGWHVYWRNPGDTGLAPRFDWSLPGGGVGALAWPTPQAFVDRDADLVSYGYERPVLFAATAHAPPGATLAVTVDALVCAHLCIPGRFELAAALPAGARSRPAVRARFEAEARRLPGSTQARGVRIEARRAEPSSLGPRWTLRVEPCPGRACDVAPSAPGAPALAPHASDSIAWRASPPRALAAPPGAFEIDVAGEWLGPPLANPTLAGVVPLRDAAGRDLSVAFAIDAPEPAAAGLSLWSALLFGFLGGLVLNAMPCVLPVLALKLASLATLAHGGRRARWRHAGAYTAGIALSMLALAGAVVALRAAGVAVGWGFQLQEPAFVLGIACVLVVFAANLFGAFEIRFAPRRLGALGAGAPGAARSFFDGLLATLLATPCTAPLLGSAVGFAFASEAPAIVAVFVAIGLGLAAPFALAAVFPSGARWLPRPGPWMDELRRGLGFTLLVAVVWLLWVLGRSAGVSGVCAALALLLALAFIAWALGAAQRGGHSLAAGALALALAGVGIGGLGVVDVEPHGADPAPPAIGAARPWSEADVRASVAAGRPVFVYFTADWCLTCKLNEARVLDDPLVAAALARDGYDVYRADWTRRDAAIGAALARLGRAGVPAYALWSPGAPEPRVLPELLTLDGLLTALHDAAASQNARS